MRVKNIRFHLLRLLVFIPLVLLVDNLLGRMEDRQLSFLALVLSLSVIVYIQNSTLRRPAAKE